MQKYIRKYVSHIKFVQIVQKGNKQEIYGGHRRFSLFVHFLQNICKAVHLGCVRGYM